MSDQDELRDRIADSQRKVLKRRALIADVDLPSYLAQAVIDDLGLTVETSMFGGRKDEGAPYRASHVVGKWEKQ